MKTTLLSVLLFAVALAPSAAADAVATRMTFGADLALLKQHTDVVVLSSPSGKSQVAVVPAYEGRVMTSTGKGLDGDSYGWLNRSLITSGKTVPHMNAYGGEDRIWFGPEGGQFGLFFAPGVPFDFGHWQTPGPIDTEKWDVDRQSAQAVSFSKAISLTNRSGTKFAIRANRLVRLATADDISKVIGQPVPGDLSVVAYETTNRITNTGDAPWSEKTGLISIWILGQYNPSDNGAVVIPFKPGSLASLGAAVNDAYFGKVAADRLKVDVDKGVLFFKCDGESRGKIGIGPARATNILGSYDPDKGILTIVRFGLHLPATKYVNSMWEIQKAPYSGDVVNSYNDGPLKTGGQLGPFYELETSSPALELAPGQSVVHRRLTIHMQGPTTSIDPIAYRLLGVHLDDIKSAFKS